MRRFQFLPAVVSFRVSFLFSLVFLPTALIVASNARAQNPAPLSKSAQVHAAHRWGELPLAFEPNRGQTDSAVDYLSRGPGCTAFLNSSGATLSLHSQNSSAADALRFTLLGANRPLRASAEQEITGKVNYLIGNDPTKWKVGVPQYSRVRYAAVYPGIDLVYYGNPAHLEYDFVVQPGADFSKIALQMEGGKSIRVTKNGDLSIQLPDGDIAWKRPEVYQLRNGQRQPVSAGYQLAGNTVRFTVGDYDRTRPLIIDPSLTFGTYIGGPDGSGASAIAIDSSQNVYLAGIAISTQYPTTPGSYQTTFGGYQDAFITKLSADGSTLLYSTYVGGYGSTSATSIAVDSSGNSYVGGSTSSKNFPITPGAFHLVNTVNNETGFILELNATGSALIYSAEIGGAGVSSLAIDGAGDVYSTGTQFDPPFETTPGAYKTTAGSSECTYILGDDYVLELNPTGTALVYSTYISDCEIPYGIAVQDGEAYITGTTDKYHPVTPGVVQPTYGGDADAFVTKLNTSGSALVYSTYLGGSLADQGNSIAVDSSGNAVVVGATESANFPLANAFQSTFTGGSGYPGDAFVTKLNPSGTDYVYSTFLGGSSNDNSALRVAVDASGSAYVVGGTTAADFPLQDAFQGICGVSSFNNCVGSPFISKFNSTGSLLSSTYYGSTTGTAGASALAIDSSGNAYIAGASTPGLATTSNAYEKTTTGNEINQVTVFAAKINMSGTTGCTNLRQSRTVAICTPSTTSDSGNLVHVSAVVNDSNTVNAIQVYVDGVLEFEEDTGNQIDSYVQVASGTHRLTVKAWDKSGSFESVRYVTVSGSSTSSCTVGEILPYVQICTPLANSTSTSPVHVNASAVDDAAENNETYPVTAMRLYVDNVSYYTVDDSATLNTSVTLSSGVHRLTVEAWDGKGDTWKQVVYVTVQ